MLFCISCDLWKVDDRPVTYVLIVVTLGSNHDYMSQACKQRCLHPNFPLHLLKTVETIDRYPKRASNFLQKNFLQKHKISGAEYARLIHNRFTIYLVMSMLWQMAIQEVEH